MVHGAPTWGQQAGHEAATVVSPAMQREPLHCGWFGRLCVQLRMPAKAIVRRVQWSGDGVPLLSMRRAAYTCCAEPPTHL